MADVIPFRPRPVDTRLDYEEDVLCDLASSILDRGDLCIYFDDDDTLIVEIGGEQPTEFPDFGHLVRTLGSLGVPARMIGREAARIVMDRAGIAHTIAPTGLTVRAQGGVA